MIWPNVHRTQKRNPLHDPSGIIWGRNNTNGFGIHIFLFLSPPLVWRVYFLDQSYILAEG